MATYAIGDVQGCYDELAPARKNPLRSRARHACGSAATWSTAAASRSRCCAWCTRSASARSACSAITTCRLLAIAERDEADQAKVNPRTARGAVRAGSRLAARLAARAPAAAYRSHAELHARARRPGAALDIDRAERAAREVEQRLRGEGARRLLKAMFGNKPDLWTPRLQGIDRLRATINVLTRMRYCDVRGRIAYNEKGAPGTQKAGAVSVVRGARPEAARYPHRLRTLVDPRPLPGHGRLRDRRRLRLGRRTDRAASGRAKSRSSSHQVDAARRIGKAMD